MSDGAESFGRRAAGVESASELLELEQREGMGERFESLDAIAGEFVLQSVRGEHTLVATDYENLQGRGRKAELLWGASTDVPRSFLNSTFSVEAQQSRGAWSLPDEVTIRTGLINFVPVMLKDDFFAHNLISEGRYRVELASSPEAVFAWSVAEPFFEELFIPFKLRGEQEGKSSKSREKQIEEWRAVRELYVALDIDALEHLWTMGYGHGWSKMKAEEKRAVKRGLAEVIHEQADVDTWRHYRALKLHSLLKRYYAKANSRGEALRKRVMTKDSERVLSGIFGGDWLSFLNYLGEAPHPEEQITTALPESKLYLGQSQKARNLAEEHGLGADLAVEGLHISVPSMANYHGLSSSE